MNQQGYLTVIFISIEPLLMKIDLPFTISLVDLRTGAALQHSSLVTLAYSKYINS